MGEFCKGEIQPISNDSNSMAVGHLGHMPTTTTASTVATAFSKRRKANAASLVLLVPPVLPVLLAQPENGLDVLDALQAVSVTELVATLLLPSVMVMVATYEPATSALKLGVAVVVLASVALLPSGLVVKAHA